MTDKQHAYDPDLPYVVEGPVGSEYVARFAREHDTHLFLDALTYPALYRVIDTTPAPRVPEDAKFIMYPGILSARYFAFREGVEWGDVFGEFHDSLEDLPGVTPDTVFTVLEERKSDA